MTQIPPLSVRHHADRGDHRIQRENDIHDGDLHDDTPERRVLGNVLLMLAGSYLGVDLVNAFPDQKQPADQQDEILNRHFTNLVRQPLAGQRQPGQFQDRFGQAQDPGERQQEGNAHPHRGCQSQSPSTGLLILGKPARKNRDEDDIVDPQHDLHRRQGHQRNDVFH